MPVGSCGPPDAECPAQVPPPDLRHRQIPASGCCFFRYNRYLFPRCASGHDRKEPFHRHFRLESAKVQQPLTSSKREQFFPLAILKAMSRTSSSDPFRDTFAATWNELERRLDDLLRQAHSAPADAFRADFLRDLGQAVGAAAANWWRQTDGDGTDPGVVWEVAAQWHANSGIHEHQASAVAARSHDLARRAASMANSAMDSSPTSPWEAVPEAHGPEALAWSLLEVLPVAPGARDAVELFWSDLPPQAIRENLLRLIAAHCEVAGDFLRREAAEATRRELLDEQALSSWALQLQRQADSRLLASIISNGIAGLLPCDRVFVVTHVPRTRVLDVSRSEAFDRRSPIIRQVERLAESQRHAPQSAWRTATTDAVEATGEPVWTEYWEESTSRTTAVVSLQPAPCGPDEVPGERIGCLVVERFAEEPFGRRERRLLERGAAHAAACLERIQRHQARGLLRWLRQPTAALFVLAGIALVMAGAWPINLEIAAQGEIQPKVRRDVFAPLDGLVRELRVREGLEVSAGDLLLSLANDDLDFEQTRLDGELQTARKQLATVAAARLGTSPTGDSRESPTPLAGEEERLKQVIHGLESQRELLRKRQQQLQVIAPCAGRVVTPDLDQRLRDRPLRRGQHLCTIVDEAGEWELRLRVADRDLGHVLKARLQNPSLPLRYTFASSPGESHVGAVASVADWTEFDERGAPVARLTATLPQPESRPARSGTTVFARIHCGQRPLAYVWLRDVWELLRTRWLLY